MTPAKGLQLRMTGYKGIEYKMDKMKIWVQIQFQNKQIYENHQQY